MFTWYRCLVTRSCTLCDCPRKFAHRKHITPALVRCEILHESPRYQSFTKLIKDRSRHTHCRLKLEDPSSSMVSLLTMCLRVALIARSDQVILAPRESRGLGKAKRNSEYAVCREQVGSASVIASLRLYVATSSHIRGICPELTLVAILRYGYSGGASTCSCLLIMLMMKNPVTGSPKTTEIMRQRLVSAVAVDDKPNETQSEADTRGSVSRIEADQHWNLRGCESFSRTNRVRRPVTSGRIVARRELRPLRRGLVGGLGGRGHAARRRAEERGSKRHGGSRLSMMEQPAVGRGWFDRHSLELANVKSFCMNLKKMEIFFNVSKMSKEIYPKG